MAKVWQGWGFLVPVIGAVIFVTVQAVTGQLLREAYCRVHPWPALVACALSALTYWRLGRWLEEDDQRHSFMFVPVRWWSLVALAFGVFFLFKPVPAETVSARSPATAESSAARTPRSPSIGQSAPSRPAAIAKPVEAAEAGVTRAPVPASQ